MHRFLSTCGLGLVAWLLVTTGQLAAQTAESPSDLFERAIRPLLLDRCIECHGPTKQEHQVRLDRRSDVLTGAASDIPLVVPGQPDKSRLWQVLQHSADDIRMPSSGKLDQPSLDAVQSWILQGAPWPETANLEADAVARLQRWRQHWAFQPVHAPDLSTQPPDTQTIDWLIDRQLQPHQLQRSPPAPAGVIARRLSYAITGLPPELTELESARIAEHSGSLSAWLTDYTERLLAQPQYGERWGRYWLDVARYADTKGYVFTENREYTDAWRYREWVIRSLNHDQGFDQFIHQQLAADRLPGADDPAQLAAMGFLTLGRRFLNNTHDIIDDRIDLVTRGLMGVTVSCARCHDHKYDPISQADYYSLYGVFASSDEPGTEPSPLRLIDRPQPVEPVIFLRGNPGNRGPAVPRRFPVALAAPDAPVWQSGSGRLELAQAITSTANPLTARVAVNRVWMHLFGRGLVETPGDFGIRTDKPQHAELLDWLAAEFMASGWSRKALLRTILRSETWRQSSDRRPDAEPVDPENRLLARMNRLRLDFEAQRDSVLAASGQLDRTVGGPSADLANDPAVTRRAVYARIDRQNLPGIFRTFDLASPDAHAPRRYQTTIPQQALFYLNNSFVLNQSAEIARVTAAAGEDRIAAVFGHVLRRSPTSTELADCHAFLQTITELQQVTGQGGWQLGRGSLPENALTVSDFQTLTVVREGRLQAGDQLPDPQFGWVFLNRNGGHPGNDLQHCAIRRWTADNNCRVLLHGVITHPSDQGDGIRLRVLAADGRLLAETSATNGTQTIAAAGIQLQAGQFIDFVVDCRTNSSHDSFRSKFVVTQTVDGQPARIWNSEQDFREAPSPRQDPWAQLAQTLLLTNEFSFID
jgi:hypothetical protein